MSPILINFVRGNFEVSAVGFNSFTSLAKSSDVSPDEPAVYVFPVDLFNDAAASTVGIPLLLGSIKGFTALPLLSSKSEAEACGSKSEVSDPC